MMIELPMTSGSVTLRWMLIAFAVALCLTIVVLGALGAGERGTDAALQLTGRLAFLLFWPAYAGKSARRVFGPIFEPLKRRAQEFGLCFAAVMVVHVSLIAWLCIIKAPPAAATFAVFGPALLLTYVLAARSVEKIRNLFGQKVWSLLLMAGSHYILFVFALDFIRRPPVADAKYVLGYLPFNMLIVAGLLIRFAAFAIDFQYLRWKSQGSLAGKDASSHGSA